MTFVALVVALPEGAVVPTTLAWGLILLGALSVRIARFRKANPLTEALKHILVALLVVVLSRILGGWLASHVV
jgi:VIT1/CCC1 family predicted Fe2+/Mn2+ transporter